MYGTKTNPILSIHGCDSNGSIYSLFTKVVFKRKNDSAKTSTKEPY